MNAPRRRHGLSLIELLVVITIMCVAAGMVVSMTDKMDGRSRHQETVRRLGEIRSAVLGPDAVSPTGELMSGGYLQDTGWLPDAPGDLLRAPQIASGTNMPALAYDSLWRTWAGWRGPYVAAAPARATGGTNLYDDFGHDYYGWFCETSSEKSWQRSRLGGAMPLRSAGADGRKDSAGGRAGVYERDYPAEDQPLIAEADWVSDLRGLQVEVTNLTAVDFSASPVAARLRIVVPRWDKSDPLGYWPADANDDFVGQSFLLSNAPVGDDYGRNQKVYDFASVGRSIRIPHGRRMLFLVQESDGRPIPGVRCWTELAVSSRLSPPSYVRLFIRN
jgi:prepilin-type N-terminal cleavage/methylation domain-containing protein